jgi:hypothetical protein
VLAKLGRHREGEFGVLHRVNNRVVAATN